MAHTLFILDNTTTDSEGHCQSDHSWFYVKVDDNTFTFRFNKTDGQGTTFDYQMVDFHVNYNPKSKYFPNHAGNCF